MQKLIKAKQNGGLKCLKKLKTKTKNLPETINGLPLIKRASLTNVKDMTVPAEINRLPCLCRDFFNTVAFVKAFSLLT